MSGETNFDLSEASKDTSSEGVPFERFGLCRNPFPKSAVAEAERARSEKFSRCRKVALDKLRKFIVTVYKAKRWSGLIVRGEAGSGKSHTFFYVSNEINRQLGELDKEKALSIYIENPKDTINELFQDIMEHIDREVFETQVANAIQEKATPILEYALKQPQLFKPKESTYQDPLNKLRQIGSSIVESALNKAIDSIVKELSNSNIAQHQDFARCICILILDKDAEKRNSAWKFCIGKTLSKNESRNLRLVSDKLSEDEIIRYVFPSMIQILNKNNVRMLFLFLDEIEKIASKSDNRRKDFLENLRSLIDNNLNGFCMIFSCLTEAWEILSSTSPALSDRMGEIVDLDPLLQDQAILLIEDYLGTARLPTYNGNTISPFDERTIEKINTLSRGSIRQVLQNCNIVLEHATSNEEIKNTIPVAFIEKTLGKGIGLGALYSYS